jgi:hypothetical protein
MVSALDTDRNRWGKEREQEVTTLGKYAVQKLTNSLRMGLRGQFPGLGTEVM